MSCLLRQTLDLCVDVYVSDNDRDTVVPGLSTIPIHGRSRSFAVHRPPSAAKAVVRALVEMSQLSRQAGDLLGQLFRSARLVAYVLAWLPTL